MPSLDYENGKDGDDESFNRKNSSSLANMTNSTSRTSNPDDVGPREIHGLQMKADDVSDTTLRTRTENPTRSTEETTGEASKMECNISTSNSKGDSNSNSNSKIEGTKQSAPKKGKKRNRKDRSNQDDVLARQLALKQDRYDKLLHQAKKQLLKQAKQVRTFMVQRQIRKLKNSRNSNPTSNDNQHDEDSDDQHNDDDKDEEDDADQQRRLQLQHQRLQPLKELSLDLVVQQAIRQLGLIHANPDPNATFETTSNLSSNTATTSARGRNAAAVGAEISSTTNSSALISSILDHKRFQASLEEWNDKVADFRRFCLSLDDRHNPFPSHDDVPLLLLNKRQKQSKKGGGTGVTTRTTSLRAQQQSQQLSEQPTSYFCSSLNDASAPPPFDDMDDNGEIDNGMTAYGPAANMMMTEDGGGGKPKNRRGQRARKAKAVALEAKKEGRQYQSLNWREEKKSKQEQQQSTSTSDRHSRSLATKEVSKSQVTKKNHTAMSSTKARPAAETASAPDHPSWTAKQQQKTGIVAFQGKKITFD